ncbi:transmembrane prolyl 4-hydroxylase [Nematostella vectensis]|uniref:transmembrane prolyl 4-hydroxylase n=1 Tax=Nematostella vectensis TaxID=45351 RepID=UPI00139032E4|nr:transmembrane prolyl 4-hydroxylase [Nematostella vectensis]
MAAREPRSIVTISTIFLQFCVLCTSDLDPRLRIPKCYKQEGGCERAKHEKTFGGPCMVGRAGGVTKLDPVKVGHVEEIDVGDKVVKITTRAMKPPVFEIPNFLSDEECDFFINYAKHKRMMFSEARGGLTLKEQVDVPKIRHGRAKGIVSIFSGWDTNNDGFITVDEVLAFARKYYYMQLKEPELRKLLRRIKAHELDDDVITKEEFEKMDTQAIDDAMLALGLTHPRYRHRLSEQTWINQRLMKRTPILETIQARLIKLTGLTKEIIYGSERIQVVRYTKFGHYHAHYDSETHKRTDVPCCHLMQDPKKLFTYQNPCRICRYLTVLYYLNDVEDGGETAFPVADNVTLDRAYMEMTRGIHDYFNMNENCKTSNLVIKPRRGLAVMWYNHMRDEATGWMGAMDDYSLHGGCEVFSGEKWIANSWITAPYADGAYMGSLWLRNITFIDDI